MTKFLTADQIVRLEPLLGPDFCARLSTLITTELFQELLLRIGVGGTVATQLIQCLIDAGVQFGTTPG